MKKTFHTTEQILNAYTLYKQGLSFDRINKEMGMVGGFSWRIITVLERYLKRRPRKYGKKTYLQAVKIIKNGQAPTVANDLKTEVVTVTAVNQDHFDLFKQASSEYEKQTAIFIEAEVTRQVGEIKNQVEDLKILNNELKLENEKLTEAFELAKNSNWVDHLKKSFAKT